MSTHLVTGVAGFIGSNLAQTLLSQGEKVIGIDNFNNYYAPQLKQNNIKPLQRYPAFELIESDILEIDWLTLLPKVNYIYHQAAQAGVRASWGSSFRHYTERNINATQVILEAAKEVNSLERFVFASTSSVYGNAASFPTPESVCPKPVSPYGITKLAAEQMCWLYQQNFDVPITALRYFTVYGPGQRPDMAFHKFLKAAVSNKIGKQSASDSETIEIYGDGQQTRDFTFISDIVAANLAAATAKGAIGQVFNIGGGSRVVLESVLEKIEAVIGKPLPRRYREKARGDARHTSADITKAQQVLGYQPQVELTEGLAREWEWIKTIYQP